MSLKNNILRIFSANFLTMISGILIGFIVPAILSIESYSFVKTYTFYISYIGFLHLGFIDGMYIKYGGKEVDEINKSELKSEHRVFMILQFGVTIIFLIVSFVAKDIILFLMGLSIIPINTLAFHKLLYQATGRFKEYSKISYTYTIAYLVLNIMLTLVFRSDNYIYYCLTTLIANGIVYFFLEVKFYYNNKAIKTIYNPQVWKNIRIGFFVLLGNLSVMLFYAIDRVFIKIFFDVSTFAYYSFAISMLNIVNVLVSSISITFYNYLSKKEDEEKIKKLKNYFLIMGTGASLGYFVLAAIVSEFMTKYNPSLNVIAISFAAYPYMIIINVLYVNLYKARKNEKKYLKVVFTMVIISAIYNIIAVIIWRRAEAIAVSTTLAFITWYIYSMKDFKYLKSSIKEIIYLCIIIIAFIGISNKLSWLFGGICYLIIVLIVNIIFYKRELLEFIGVIIKR